MLIKWLVVILLLLIGGSLAMGLFYLVRDQGTSKNVVKSLSWRVGLSISLFILLIVLFFWAGIEPHNI